MEIKFDVYFAGSIKSGADQNQVKTEFARLFKIDELEAAKRFDGGRYRIKTDCDKATAIRYQKALDQIGAVAIIERRNEAPPPAAVVPEASAAVASAEIHDESPSKDLASDLAGSFTLAEVGARMDQATSTPPPAISVPNFDIAEAGEIIPTIKPDVAPAKPETGHLSLAPLSDQDAGKLF
ncbi:hypothetical protein [Luminiphilus syltensis]|uniref:hypothetical protein n=1 Tax=Luminiphilus syltensis TaxID=1341119 RepID=UPI00031200C3|nr:hypothetical protein [Luminiphilus syltensis]